MQLNILLSSAGKKVFLVRAFQTALKRKKGLSGKVICVDSSPLSPSFPEADEAYVVPLANHPEYIPQLVKICRKHKIRMLIPSIDAELLPLAENLTCFQESKTQVIISRPEVVAICNDKYKTYQFLSHHRISTPKTYLGAEIKNIQRLNYPLFVKPRCGFSSQGAFKVKNPKQLRFLLAYRNDLVLQPFLNGREFTLDALADLNGRVISVVPRERIEVQAGISTKGRTVKNEMLIQLGKEVMEKLGIIGPANIQCFLKDNRAQITEINPRFGSGYCLSLAAGADYPALLLEMVCGRKLNSLLGKFRDNVVMLRYYEEKFSKE